MQQVRSHPQVAAEWLRQSGVTDPDWLAAVSHHHEHEDGGGYPRGVKEVPEIAVVLRTTDIFLTKISARSNRSAMTIQDALRALYIEGSGGPISSAIVKEFGIFPPGELVCLSSGEVGVVVKRTESVIFPIVAVITDYSGKPVSYTVRRDTKDPQYSVLGSVTDQSLVANLPAERLFGLVDIPLPLTATLAQPESP